MPSSQEQPSDGRERVTYRSYLLRIRRVEGEGVFQQQYFVRDVQSQEAFYFTVQAELVRFLHGPLREEGGEGVEADSQAVIDSIAPE